MNLVVLILALVFGSVLALSALLLVPAWLLQRFLCVAHAGARQEMLACRLTPKRDRTLQPVPSSHAS